MSASRDPPGAAFLPPVSKLREFSQSVAIAVAKEAKAEGLNRMNFSDAEAIIKACEWTPAYHK
jgi:malic enzyme